MSRAAPPLFLDSAREIYTRLLHVVGPAASMCREAEEILAVLEQWERGPVSVEERARTIQRLINLHRRAMDFLIKARID